jgi:hypothetical protein
MIRDYRPGDIQEIYDPKEPGDFHDQDMNLYYNYAETIEEGGKVEAVMGIVRMWRGVGQCFVITSSSYKGGITYVRAAKAFMEKAIKHLGLWRVQTYIDEDWTESKRFAELTGLAQECALRKMSPEGRDLHLYVRIEE